MSELLIYIGKVLVIQAIFYGFYRLVLRNSIRHGWNRLFLLAALVVSFVIPFIQIPDQLPVQPLEESPVIVWVQESAMEFEMVPVRNESQETVFSFWQFLPWLYVLVACFLIVRSMVYLFFIRKLKKHSEYVKKRWFKLFKTSQTRPFSFFSNVFIPKDVFGSNAFDQILAHECVHVKQRHSVDRLLMDFLVSLFWFNPFIYLYRNALIEIHEFQADEAVINQFNDPIGYQEVLYSQLQHATYSGLVSHFNFSMIKKRIVMMNKQKNKYAGLLYALTLPVLVSVVFAFSGKEAIKPIKNVGNELAEILSPEPDFKLLTLNLPEPKAQLNSKENQDSKVPSVMPVKSSGSVRLSSNFGMRMHPIYKVKKMHLGTDFACKEGSEIIATADGVITEIKTEFKGYGKRIVIDHENGFKTRYAQLSEFKVEEGDRVKKGDLIALSGNSGASTAPHLHYEVQKGDKRVDPMDYIDDFKAKPVMKETPSGSSNDEGNEEMLDALDEKKEMLRAKEAAEREQIEQLKAQERQMAASEQMVKAQLLQREAEEKRLKAELLDKEKEKNKQKEKSKGKDKSKNKGEQQAYRIILDPGHGGKDSGATFANGRNEKEEMLQLAIEIADQLKSLGDIDVLLTRDQDDFLSLKDRVKQSESADLIVSLHVGNLGGPSGILPVFQSDGNYPKESKVIAEKIKAELMSVGRSSTVGFTEGESNYYLLRESSCPSVMINISESELSNQRELIASHISQAIQSSIM